MSRCARLRTLFEAGKTFLTLFGLCQFCPVSTAFFFLYSAMLRGLSFYVPASLGLGGWNPRDFLGWSFLNSHPGNNLGVWLPLIAVFLRQFLSRCSAPPRNLFFLIKVSAPPGGALVPPVEGWVFLLVVLSRPSLTVWPRSPPLS